jgi:mannose-1-phosphate guanylyltransferase
VLVAPTAKIGVDCKLGPDVSIGEGCVIGDGVRLSNCVIMRGVSVGHHTKVRLELTKV